MENNSYKVFAFLPEETFKFSYIDIKASNSFFMINGGSIFHKI